MVNYSSRSLDLSFHALSDPTRRAILARIAKGESTVSELAGPFNMSLAAVSKHLQVLERAEFVKKTKAGRVVTCTATLEPLNEMSKLLEDLGRYWSSKLDSLEKFLADELDTGETHATIKTTKRNASVTGHTKGHSHKKR